MDTPPTAGDTPEELAAVEATEAVPDPAPIEAPDGPEVPVVDAPVVQPAPQPRLPFYRDHAEVD